MPQFDHFQYLAHIALYDFDIVNARLVITAQRYRAVSREALPCLHERARVIVYADAYRLLHLAGQYQYELMERRIR